MNDNGDDEVPEQIKNIIKAGISVAEILSEFGDTKDAGNVLAIAMSHLLCCKCSTESDAHDLFDMIIDHVDSSVDMTKQHGMTSWVEGTPH